MLLSATTYGQLSNIRTAANNYKNNKPSPVTITDNAQFNYIIGMCDTIPKFWYNKTQVDSITALFAPADTTALSNRINLKLNIADTVGKWLLQSTPILRIGDSTTYYSSIKRLKDSMAVARGLIPSPVDTASYWNKNGNTFGATSKLMNNDANELDMGVNGIVNDQNFPRGTGTLLFRRIISAPTNTSGTAIGVTILDSNRSTSTGGTTAFDVAMFGGGGSGTKLLQSWRYSGSTTPANVLTLNTLGDLTAVVNSILSYNTINSVSGSQYGSIGLTNGSGVGVTRNTNDVHAGWYVNNQHASSTGAVLRLQSGGSVVDSFSKTGNAAISGNLSLYGAASKILIKTGSNSTIGTATLSSGTVTVSNTAVTANSLIWINCKTASGTNLGIKYDYTVSAGTSFTVTAKTILNATETGETSTIQWIIIDTQ